MLDKYTWLGETGEVTELMLKVYYPELDTKEYQQVWAAHVEDGIASIRNFKSLSGLSMAI